MSKSQGSLILKDIHHSYAQGDGGRLHVLTGCTLSLDPGTVTALVGVSGSGKSTLLHIAGLLEKPTQGDVVIMGEDMAQAGDKKRTHKRLEHLGFVYQFHHLLPEFTALENVLLPLYLQGIPEKQARDQAKGLLDRVGLSGRFDHRPSQLSGGEQQRVAMVRALAGRPKVLLADEPTGNLDTHTAGYVFDLLMTLVREQGLAALIATHDPSLARKMDRQITLKEGTLQER